MVEQIICSAVWYKDLKILKEVPNSVSNPINIDYGIVFCGFRHCHCMYTMVKITGLRSVENAEDGVGKSIQGFLTNKNRFVNRQEGAIIHINNGGILKYSSDELYSEDLY